MFFNKKSKEEKKRLKQQEKEQFIKLKDEFKNEINEKSAFSMMMFFIIGGTLSLSLILADFFGPTFVIYAKTQIINRIGLWVIFLILFILTRIKALKKFWTIFFTTALGATVFYGMSITVVTENSPAMMGVAVITILFLYFFSNSNTLISTIYVLLSFPFFIIFTILMHYELKGVGFFGILTNGITYMFIGILIHYVSFRLKKREFITRKILAEKNTQINEELKVAGAVQKTVLEEIPNKIGDINVSLLFQPFSEVSGDFYDLYKINDSKYAIFLGDVVGHGVSAALITTMAKTLLHHIILENMNVNDICKEMNNKVYKELGKSKLYITGVFLIINVKDNTIEYSNAGHPSPYFYESKNDKLNKLSVSGFYLGIKEGMEYKSEKIKLNKGDRVILYTDGLTEAKNAENKLYMNIFETNLVNIIKTSDINLLSENLYRDVKKYSGNIDINDDVTIISIGF